MITVSVAINGQPIYTRTAVNKGPIVHDEPLCIYEVDDGSFLEHKPGEGAIVLAKMMLDTIREQR